MMRSKGPSDSPAGLPSDPSYSLGATAIDTPAPDNPPPARPAAPSDISGVWRSRDGEVYTFQQQGSELLLTLQVNGVAVGTGRGALNGPTLQLAVVVQKGNTPLQANCSLQAGPESKSFTGLCSGPRGQYPVHIFR